MKDEVDTKFFNELRGAYKAYCALITGIFNLLRLEFHLAKKSVIAISFLVFLLFIFSATLWFWINVLLIIYGISLGLALVSAIFAMLAVNVLCVGIFGALLVKYRQNISFSATRKQLRASLER
jgi:hypothetical protein